MRTFSIQTLGCKVNHYESEQIAAILRCQGWIEADAATADLRIINTCSITTQAASKSRQSVRRAVRLPILQSTPAADSISEDAKSRVLVVGCWATSDRQTAAAIPGVDAVLTHGDDVAGRLAELLRQWKPSPCPPWPATEPGAMGTRSLPLLGQRQTRHQRAFLKIQDGCDAHCTYCIIPNLRPRLWSKSPADVLEEARRLVDAGHVELVLTGIFLGAFGHHTALRRRQSSSAGKPLTSLIDLLCTGIPGLRRLRLSSLEPGDLDDDLLHALRSHQQVVPHFHLPLQSGSSLLLRKMNRQYTRDDYLRLLDRIRQAFDRPALTTDIIVGFPGETEAEFQQTLDVARRARFIHIHAFPFSPRPGTAAARWRQDFVHGPVVGQRIELLTHLADEFSLAFRSQFIGQTVQVLVERDDGQDALPSPPIRHGRCQRYFDVEFPSNAVGPGDLVDVRMDRVLSNRTLGTLLSPSCDEPIRTRAAKNAFLTRIIHKR